jgi:hypothetical protein
VKKIASALLIILLLFNWFGYNLVVNYLQQKSDTHLEVLLDNNQYTDAQLIELKIPIHLAYQSSWSSYERYDGEIELNGTLYKYVKRKVSNDTLYLKCIPNIKKMNLETSRNDFFKNTNDIAQNSNSNKSDNSKSFSFKNLISDYDTHSHNCCLNISPILPRDFYFTYQVNNIPAFPHITLAQPPDLVSA